MWYLNGSRDCVVAYTKSYNIYNIIYIHIYTHRLTREEEKKALCGWAGAGLRGRFAAFIMCIQYIIVYKYLYAILYIMTATGGRRRATYIIHTHKHTTECIYNYNIYIQNNNTCVSPHHRIDRSNKGEKKNLSKIAIIII